MTQREALDWLQEVEGQLYRNNRHQSGRDAWVAVVRTPRDVGHRGKSIVSLGGSMEEATTAAAHQWQALCCDCGPIQ